MISIVEREQRIERNMKPPPWATVPLGVGAAGVGAYSLGKKVISWPFKKAEELRRESDERREKDKAAVSKAYEKFDRSDEDNPKSRSEYASKIKKLHREEQLKPEKDKESIGKAYEKLYGKDQDNDPTLLQKTVNATMENLNRVIALGLLNELNKIPIKTMKINAAKKALFKGQKRILSNPADKVARAHIDGGNRLMYGALKKEIPMRTVS